MTAVGHTLSADFDDVADQLGPLLNRLVFFGIETCRGQLESMPRVRTAKPRTPAFNAIATAALDRTVAELPSQGWKRLHRDQLSERWSHARGFTLAIEAVPDGESAGVDSGVLEYASLLTRTVSLERGAFLRVSALVAQFPLLWRAHARSGLSFGESPWIEDIIELVMRRPAILEEILALPAELRHLVSRSASEFANSETARWAIARALPDSRVTPGIADAALRRFREIAARGAA